MLWNKIKKKAGSRGGFTLIELVVAIAIFAILMTCIITLIMPVMNTYSRSKELADSVLLATNLSDEITSELAYATKVDPAKVSGNTVEFEKYGGYTITLSEEDGYLTKNGAMVFDPEYYGNSTISIEYTYNEATKVFNVHLVIHGRAEFTYDFTVHPMAL